MKIEKEDVLIGVIIITVALISFALGRFSVRYQENGVPNQPVQTGTVIDATQPEKPFVASVNGTRYYFTWCSGVERISEENKVYFRTRADAEEAGYTKSKTCNDL